MAVDLVARYFEELTPAAGLRVRTSALARELGHFLYGRFHLALAGSRGTQLVTADGRLLARLQGSPLLALTQPLAAKS